ncbi:hypothetical protein [Bradyrhizobium sp. SZCCHNS3053]|uniref:hypothetical protein n=1 Tax=Bradyrhizobium sp. SZCCHNS3053 TaxID=3057322 RepID=UPI002916AEC6|nr:hypothetical protein [Bradyrhizobium sp. SZCCHNS3053]
MSEEAEVEPKATKGKRAAKKRGKKVTNTKRKVSDPSSAKGKPWTFPKNSLEDAIRIPKEIEEKNAGNAIPVAELATAVGFRLANDWRFLDLLRSSDQYGLVERTGGTVSLTKLGQDVVAPSSPSQRSDALISAFRKVKDFEAVEKFYGGKRIPEDEFFLNTLTREFNIPRDRVDAFAKTFVDNLKFLRAFNPSNVSEAQRLTDETLSGTTPADKIPTSAVPREPRIREFLDTCFVMMPFGSWFDRYYQDIYAPAIKEAGFEPVRADELFTTGSVVEQIWEQIQKAKVLLADLSGKNANVFYELGLAHAAKKPVVFTSALVEDVPFDLRHLRVIIYDIREPEWAPRLRKSISDYLRNAMKEPDKSIPHPFRFLEDVGEAPARLGRRGQ